MHACGHVCVRVRALQGHLPQSDALTDGRAAALITASPPGSPNRGASGLTALTHQQMLTGTIRVGSPDTQGAGIGSLRQVSGVGA